MNILLISINETDMYTNSQADQATYRLRKAGFSVDILYCHDITKKEEIINSIACEYEVVGVLVQKPTYKGGYFAGLDIAKAAKADNGIIFAAGPFSTNNYVEILVDSAVSYVLLGDYVESIAILVEKQASNQQIPQLPYIASINDINNKKPYVSTEVFDVCYDFYDDTYENNRTKIHWMHLKNNVCPTKCSFCENPQGKLAIRSFDSVYQEIKDIAQKGVRKFFFMDPDLFFPGTEEYRTLLKRIFKQVKEDKLHIVFTCFCRSATLKGTNEDIELLSIMRDGGLTTVFVGVDGGNEKDLEVYNKGTTVSDHYKTITLFRNNGILPIPGFINFNPYSSLESLKQNFQFLTSIGSVNHYSYCRSILKIYKGTAIYNRAIHDGLLLDNGKISGAIPYSFQSSDVADLHNFLEIECGEKLKKVNSAAHYLEIQYYDCKFLYPSIEQEFGNTIDSLKQRTFLAIQDFFTRLYVNCDIIEARRLVDRYVDVMNIISAECSVVSDALERRFRSID